MASAWEKSGNVLDLAGLAGVDPAAMSQVERDSMIARLSDALDRLSRAGKPSG